MASSMTKISSVTVGSGGAASISFTGIVQTYTDLYVKLSLRSDRVVDSDSVNMTVNGSAISTTWLYLLGNGGTTSSATAQRFYTNSNYNTASTFGSAGVYIPNYTSANYKQFTVDTVSENNGANGAQLECLAQLWSNTSAITSITFAPQFGTNWNEYSIATLYGIIKYAETGTGSKATGGTVTTSGGYTYHTFYSSGMFTPNTSVTGDFLVIGGGAAGGNDTGGGGGAGGLRSSVGTTGGGGILETALSFTAQAYPVIIGAGGAGAGSSNKGGNGTSSILSSVTSAGGGGGGTNSLSSGAGANGASGGGGSAYGAVPSGAAGTGTANQGYAGGAGSGSNSGGGGGGAGVVGSGGATSSGGNGVICSNFANATSTGISTYYAGGGGGGGTASTSGGKSGGFGGGGAGGSATTQTYGLPGVANTGGGGGGGRDDGASAGRIGGNGGSGIVIIRYTT